jgi:hypothetical protein
VAVVLAAAVALGLGYRALRAPTARTDEAPAAPGEPGASEPSPARAEPAAPRADAPPDARGTAWSPSAAPPGEPRGTEPAGTASAGSSADGSGLGAARRGEGCNQRFRHCTPEPSDRCETDTQTDVANCGLCRFDCRGLPHVVAGAVRCVAGRCVIQDACASGFADCENGVLDGCEAELASAPLHCGACGRACPAGPNAAAACQGGQCALQCHAGFYDCNGDRGDGCEASTPCNGG